MHHPPALFASGLSFRTPDRVPGPSLPGDVGVWQRSAARVARYVVGLCAHDTHEISAWAAAAIEGVCSRQELGLITCTGGEQAERHEDDRSVRAALLHLLDMALGGRASMASVLLHANS